jgi:hypothetical protein
MREGLMAELSGQRLRAFTILTGEIAGGVPAAVAVEVAPAEKGCPELARRRIIDLVYG